MKVFYSPTSPFVRKVMVLALDTGQTVGKTDCAANPIDRDQAIVDKNPTGKVPTLLLDDGSALYDSRVITRWLDAQHDGPRMYPEDDRLWTVLRREALADGLLEAAVLARYETAVRPKELVWDGWLKGQLDKIGSSLDRMQDEAADFEGVDAGLIAIGCALGYLDLRFADLDWRNGRPELAAWYGTFSSRAAMVETQPGI